jgi:hypothetical protein
MKRLLCQTYIYNHIRVLREEENLILFNPSVLRLTYSTVWVIYEKSVHMNTSRTFSSLPLQRSRKDARSFPLHKQGKGNKEESSLYSVYCWNIIQSASHFLFLKEKLKKTQNKMYLTYMTAEKLIWSKTPFILLAYLTCCIWAYPSAYKSHSSSNSYNSNPNYFNYNVNPYGDLAGSLYDEPQGNSYGGGQWNRAQEPISYYDDALIDDYLNLPYTGGDVEVIIYISRKDF